MQSSYVPGPGCLNLDSVPSINFSLSPLILYAVLLNYPETGGSYSPGPGLVLILKLVAVIPD